MKVIEILEAAKYDTCNEVKAEFGFKTNFLTLVFRIVCPTALFLGLLCLSPLISPVEVFAAIFD